MSNNSESAVTGTEYLRVVPGDWYWRPVCWVLGHEWRAAGEEETCVRCGDGTLDEPVKVSTGREVHVVETESET